MGGSALLLRLLSKWRLMAFPVAGGVITHPPIIRCWPTGQPVDQWVGLGEQVNFHNPFTKNTFF